MSVPAFPEVERMADPAVQQEIARALLGGLDNYFR